MESFNSMPVFIDVCKDSSATSNEVSGTSKASGSQADMAIVSNDKDAVAEAESQTQCLNIVTRRVRCPQCPRYTAENEEKMLRHIKKRHRGENPFQCYMCDYSTYNKCLFEEHVRIHQGIKPFECKHCDYKSAAKKNLKKHELIHRPDNPLKCSKCDFIARHQSALKCHIESHYDPVESESLKVKVEGCNFTFRDMDAYKRHELTHNLKCDLCDFKTCRKLTLKRHEREHKAKVVTKGDLFTCQICGWNSNTMPRILLHLIHHPKQKVDESVVDISILRKHGIMT